MDEFEEEQSSKKYWDAHLLAQAAQNAQRGSATRRGLWNAFTKKHMTAEAIYQLEREKETKRGNGTKPL